MHTPLQTDSPLAVYSRPPLAELGEILSIVNYASRWTLEEVMLSVALTSAAQPSRPDEVKSFHRRERADGESVLQPPCRAIRKGEKPISN